MHGSNVEELFVSGTQKLNKFFPTNCFIVIKKICYVSNPFSAFLLVTCSLIVLPSACFYLTFVFV